MQFFHTVNVRSPLTSYAAAAALCLLVAGCDDAAPRALPTRCEPSCDDQQCGHSDSCGGVCACDETSSPVPDAESCTATCDGSRCDDGCGGTCACDDGLTCDRTGECKAPSACTDTCESSTFECGNVCGAACGVCQDGLTCIS